MRFRKRIRIAWRVLSGETIDLSGCPVAVTRCADLKFHGSIYTRRDGSYGLVDNCAEECDAQEALLLGGDIWEMYAETVVQLSDRYESP